MPRWLSILVLVMSASVTLAQSTQPTTRQLRAGHTFMPTTQTSAEDDAKLIEAFAGLRVADVSDGMDAVGLHDVGLVDPSIHPLWKDAGQFAHRIVGIAVTVRYVPTQRPPAGKRDEKDFDAWVGSWYAALSPSRSSRCCARAASS